MAAANESRITSGIIVALGMLFISHLIGKVDKLEDRDRENHAAVEVIKGRLTDLSGELDDANATLKEINAKLTLIERP